MELDPVFLSRLQFAFTISFHIIFLSFTIGLTAWQSQCAHLRFRARGPRGKTMGPDSVFLSNLQFAFGDRSYVHGHRPNKVATIKARRVSKQSDAEVSLAVSREAGAHDFSVIESLKCRPRFRGRPAIALALRCAGLLALPALTGCGPGILPSQGIVGKGDTTIMIDSLAIMLAIVVPTIVATLAFAWWFRSSNSRARHRPDFVYSGQIELVTWSIPLLTIMLLGGVAWRGSHELDPARPLPSDEAPLNVQAVSLDWKWLFIYPGHNIATVNRLVIPVGTPVHFTLTSASVMNAFFVPKLGSMIYTMNRMATHLYLNADQPGTFLGMSSHFSGDGFADMQFNVEALPKDGFSAWINETRKGAAATLTSQTYRDLAKQSMKVAPFAYSAVEPDLFHKIIMQALPPGPGPVVETSPGASKRGEK